MRFPDELWNDADREIVVQAVELFASVPLVLTDQLTNTVYFNEHAEKLCDDRGESIVNRTAVSVLGIEESQGPSAALNRALLGEGEAWRGAVKPEGIDRHVVCEASAIKRGDCFLCGMIRFVEAL